MIFLRSNSVRIAAILSISIATPAAAQPAPTPAESAPTTEQPASTTAQPHPSDTQNAHTEEVTGDARLKAMEKRLAELEERAKAAEAQTAAKPPEQAMPAAPGLVAKFDGYVEMNYSYNFNRPSNGITHFRGFDNRHNAFTISNAALGASFDYETLSGRLALQWGHTPNTYYLAEPSSPGAAGTGSTDAGTFKFIQQAYVGWKAPIGRGLLLQGGVFLSPIGYEGMAVKDNWNWSRSNLFFGLPFYHTGLKATYEFTDRLSAMFLVSNGWNSVVDNNSGKSVATQWIYKVPDRLALSLLYFGGNERPTGAPEGQPWRHLFDVWSQIDVTKRLSFALQGNVGFENNTFGTSYWGTGAIYVRVQPTDWLYLAARGDRFWEHVASNSSGTASSIFWPAGWVSSGTLTADVRPHDNLSFRLEFRHDEAEDNMFFKGNVAGDGVATPYAPNVKYQNTLTAGLTGWF